MPLALQDPPGFASALADRPIDLVHLARHTFGDKALEQEVLALFLSQSVMLTERLDRARDERAWREAAHTLKGSARGIGASRVARLAEEVERHAADRSSSGACAALVALFAAVTEANAAIRDILAG